MKISRNLLEAYNTFLTEAAERVRSSDIYVVKHRGQPVSSDNPGQSSGTGSGTKQGTSPGDKQGQGNKPGQGPGDKPGDKPGQGQGNKPGDKPGQGQGNKPGQGQGDKQGQENKTAPGQGTAQDKVDKIISKQAPGKGGTPGQGQGQGQGEGGSETYEIELTKKDGTILRFPYIPGVDYEPLVGESKLYEAVGMETGDEVISRKTGKKGIITGISGDEATVEWEDAPEDKDNSIQKVKTPPDIAQKVLDAISKKADNKYDSHLTEEQAKELNPDYGDYLTPEEMKELEMQRRKDITRGLREQPSSGGQGSGVGGIRGTIDSTIPVEVDWKSVINKYLIKGPSRERSWSTINKKSIGGGYALPGWGKTEERKKLAAVFALDTSGSVGSKELMIACSYIKSIVHSVKDLEIRILLWHSLSYYLTPPIKNEAGVDAAIKSMSIQSGGTNITSVRDLLHGRNIKPKVVIYITDGLVEDGAKYGTYQKLFLLVNPQAKNEQYRMELTNKFSAIPASTAICMPTLEDTTDF